MFAGKMSLVSGSREGLRELTIRTFTTDADGRMTLASETTVEEGGGPSQVSVRDLGSGGEILVSNYALAQLAKFTF